MPSAMTVYLVGGAVRDELLDLPVKDKDWVVTGSTPEAMLAQGYQQVGKQFPVFLHPETKQEYALARKERKQGTGYKGFICDFSPDISLEQDLERRDLTINAIAKSSDGTLIDPFNGQSDLKSRVIRHVSNAFVEDPLRVLRVARFMARFAEFEFTIAPETQMLMREIAASGELSTLTPERVWRETEKALQSPDASLYFDVLKNCGALDTLFPNLVYPNAPKTSLEPLDKYSRWAIITNRTPLSEIEKLNQRLRVPNNYCWFSEQTKAFIEGYAIPLTADQWEQWLTRIAAVKKPQPYSKLSALLADLTQTDFKGWQNLRQAIAGISAQTLIKQGFSGAELGQALKRARIDAIASLNTPLVFDEHQQSTLQDS